MRRSRPPARRWSLGAALIACAAAGAAHGGGSEDGAAGLKALDRGAYDQAIGLFTRAIAAGELSADDLEFAYYNRGKAYLGKGDSKAAIADLGKALSLKPDDPGARASLQLALSGGGVGVNGRAASQPAIAARWGLLAAMAGRYYWRQVFGDDPRASYLHFEWRVPGQVLAESIRTRSASQLIGQVQLDGATGKLLTSEIESRRARYSTSDASAKTVSSYGYIDAVPIQETMTLARDGSIEAVVRQYRGGAWSAYQTTTLVEAPKEDLQALGFLKASR